MSAPSPPLGLVAELSHRCPLRCGYCSNPVALVGPADELATDAWRRVLEEAAALGVLQVHLTGGEPAARRDLEALVGHATRLGLYTNLITSGVGLDSERLKRLAAAGLAHVQLSVQGAVAGAADVVAGRAGAHAHKLALAPHVREAGVAFTLNAVVHRANLGQVPALVALARSLGAQRLEIAHAQLHGWAALNRAALASTAEAVAAAEAAIERARAEPGDLVIDWVPPDTRARRPKVCMGGWAARQLVVTPDGRALPCHAAGTLPGPAAPRVTEGSLAWIWSESELFQRFRGTAWMPEPCRSCPEAPRDGGGCRCQALAFTGDPRATDPACDRSPRHAAWRRQADEEAQAPPPTMVARRRAPRPAETRPRLAPVPE